MGLLVLVLGITAHGYYSMKYILTKDSLILKWSVFRRRISLENIQSVASVTDPKLQGIRAFGVGIPGHLVGKFYIKIDGEFVPTTFYATNLENLVILRTLDGKIFGITPDAREKLLSSLASNQAFITMVEMDTELPLRATQEIINKARLWISVLLLICILMGVGTWIYTFFVYINLPDLIPLHWGISGLPDRFGNKYELLIFNSVFTGIDILLSTLIFWWLRKSDLGKIKLGITIMLFPLLITIVFSVLMIIISQLTLNYVF